GPADPGSTQRRWRLAIDPALMRRLHRGTARARLCRFLGGSCPICCWYIEIAEEFRRRGQHHPRVRTLERFIIGLHRTVEGKKVFVLAECLRINAVAFLVAIAAYLLGLAVRIGKKHGNVLIGGGFDPLRLLTALG